MLSPSSEPIRTQALTTPETATATKHQNAISEYRRITSAVAACRSPTKAMAPSPPIQRAAPPRCRNSAEMATSWLAAPAAWPVEDCMPRATSGSARVHRAPTAPRTSSAMAAVSAAMMTIPRYVRPTAIVDTYSISAGPNPSASSGRYMDHENRSTSCTSAASVHTPAATPATPSARSTSGPRGSTQAASASAPTVTRDGQLGDHRRDRAHPSARRRPGR